MKRDIILLSYIYFHLIVPLFFNGVHCTLYSVYCTVYSANQNLPKVNSFKIINNTTKHMTHILEQVVCNVYCIHCIMYKSLYNIVYSIRYISTLYIVHYTMYSVHCTLYNVLIYTVYCLLAN